jgi:tRNA C32,U32 (ribose-2'-O)-methylase TrmJ
VPTAVARELKQAIAALAGPRGLYDTRESMLARAARRAGITFGQAKRLFYAELPNPSASLADKVRAAAAAAQEDIARNEYSQLLTAIARLEATLGTSGKDRSSPEVYALRVLVGRANSALAKAAPAIDPDQPALWEHVA